MRKLIFGAALAAAFAVSGCSGSGNSSSSSGSTNSSTTSGTTSSTSSSGSTTGSSATSSSSSGSTTASSSSSSSGSSASFCTPDGGAVDAGNDWSCLGNVTLPAPSTASATYTLQYADRQGTPIAGVTVKACEPGDTSCASPDDTQTTNDGGVAVLTVPMGDAGFMGFLDISSLGAPDAGTYVWPELAFVPPVTANVTYPLVGVRQSDVDTLSLVIGGSVDPTRGQIIGNVSDCAQTAGAGVVVGATNTDASTLVRYFQSSNFGEVPSGKISTDNTGNFLIGNDPAGTPTVMTALDGSCTPIASVPIITRAKTITDVIVAPK